MVAVAAVLIVAAVAITTATRTELMEQVDQRLEDGAAQSRVRIFDRPPPSGSFEPPPRAEVAVAERQSDFYEAVFETDGTLVVLFEPNVGDAPVGVPILDEELADLGAGQASVATVAASDGGEYRIRAEAAPSGDQVFVIGLHLDDVHSTIDRLVLVVVAGLGATLLALGLVTWWVLRHGVRPIKNVTSTATVIAGGDLSARVEETSSATESRELAAALNTMLGTIEDSVAERDAAADRLRRFVADASHELRTPVTTIRGYVELQRIGALNDPDAFDDAMRRTGAEADRMARLIEELLELAELDRGRPLERTPVDLAALAADAVADALVVAPERTITVDADGPAVVDGDDDRLRQVFANVVGNALTHTPSEASIVVHVEPGEGAVEVSVIDDGPGMDAATAERVTGRFFRADVSRSRRSGGSGLGLSIVDSVIEAHDGELRVHSGPGRGTTTSFTVPLLAEPPAESSGKVSAAADDGEEPET